MAQYSAKHSVRILPAPAPAATPVAAPIAASAVAGRTGWLRPVALASLFPGHKPADNKADGGGGGGGRVVYELRESEMEGQIHKAVYQAFAQVPRRHERVAIEDEEFFQADKTRRIDLSRKTFRSGTRLHQSLPERKSPLSTLLRPPGPPVVLKVGEPPEKVNESVPGAGVNLAFPGSIPVSLMRADIARLYNAAHFYVFSWKADGLRFLLVAGTFGGQRLLMLINRARQIFVVPHPAPSLLFDGTILDGELVRHRDGRTFSFLVYDAIMTCGVSTGEFNYLVRLQNAALLLHAWKIAGSNSKTPGDREDTVMRGEEGALLVGGGVFDVRMKPVYAPAQIADVLENVLPHLDYQIDGMILTAVEPPVQMGQTDTILKYKRGTDHTIDFLANRPAAAGTADNSCRAAAISFLSSLSTPLSAPPAEVELELLALRPGSGKGNWGVWTIAKLFAAGAETPQQMGARLGIGGGEVETVLREICGRIVECRYNPEDETWLIESIRADKTAPNKLSTAWKTWQNIRENLSLRHVFPPGAVPDDIRDRVAAWEAKNPRWPQQTDTAKPDDPPRPMAPVPLHQAIQFR